MVESIHDKLKRVRAPRVHITLDVDTGGAYPKDELPFVVGVMGDFAGDPDPDPTKAAKSLEERKFIEIDRDNFDSVMRRIGPRLDLRVENTLEGDGTELPVSLSFGSIEDFEPGNLVQQVEPLKKLLAKRDELRELLNKADRSARLDALLEQALENKDGQLDALQRALAAGGSPDEESSK